MNNSAITVCFKTLQSSEGAIFEDNLFSNNLLNMSFNSQTGLSLYKIDYDGLLVTLLAKLLLS